MDNYFSWFDDSEERLESEDVVRHLQNARDKLTPIIDDIIMSSLDLIHRGERRFIREQLLTGQQYQDMIWAFTLVKEVDYDLKKEKYILPNTNVIIQNVSVSGKRTDRPVVIDEGTVIELLQVYEQMGIIIQRIITETARTEESTAAETELSRTRVASERSILKNKSASRMRFDEDDKDVNPPRLKSTLSALLSSSSGNLKKEYSRETTRTDAQRSRKDIHKSKDVEGDATVFIRIQCFSDCSDQDYSDGTVTRCATEKCPSHYHVKLNGKPVTLKMNQANIEDGRVYCINTGNEDENDIKIVIKQCPDCKSTVIGSSTRLKDDNLGDSHESITLHGKGADESRMSYSSDEDIPKKIPRQRSVSRGTLTDPDRRSQRKMDVLIDTDNVERSKIRVRDDDIPVCDRSMRSFASVRSSIDAIRAKQQSLIIERIPLTRRKICSSLEFDVTQAHTRLRGREIEHKNGRIVLELRKLGVDQLLRACRPAKCCRKAILNEKQRTALPYCVSLRSLPLMANDVEVIKQSIDMSVKKIKNSLDLTQAYKDKLAFYVSLGRDDFRPASNLPWVIPVYDIKHGPSTSKDDDALFVLKNPIGIPQQLGSVTRLIKVITNLEKDNTENKVTVNSVQCVSRKKYFVLRKPMSKLRDTSEESQVDEAQQRARRPKRKRKIKEEVSAINENNEACYAQILKCKQTQSIHKKNNVWSNIDSVNWRLIFAQQRKNLGIHCLDLQFGKTQIGYFSEPASRASLRDAFPPLPFAPKKIPNCGDPPEESLSTMLDVYFQQFKRETKKDDISKKITSVDKSISTSQLPVSPPGEKSTPEAVVRLDKSISCPKISKSVFTETSRTLVTCVDKGVSAMTNVPKEKNICTQKKKRSRNIILRVDKALSKPKIIKSPSNELLRASKALTSFKMEDICLEEQNKNDCLFHPQAKKTKFDEKIRTYTSASKVPPQDSEAVKPIKKKLEYYVNLVDGDLLWSNTLPLAPPSYNTYYNFNREKKDKTEEESRNVENSEIPVEEPMIALKVTPDEARRVPTAAKEVGPNTSKGSTISELDIEFAALKPTHAHALEYSSKKTQKRPQLPSQYESFAMGPEDGTAPWAPYVVSQTSLPRLKEKVVIQEKVEKVEAKKVQPVPPCCQRGPCGSTECEQCKPATDCKFKNKDCRPKDIKISIRKTKNNEVYVEEMKPGPCTKEICEIYKNKKMVHGKPKKGSSTRPTSAKCETFTITAKDNMEIYINNKKVCLVNNKKDKPDENPEPPDNKKDKRRYMC